MISTVRTALSPIEGFLRKYGKEGEERKKVHESSPAPHAGSKRAVLAAQELRGSPPSALPTSPCSPGPPSGAPPCRVDGSCPASGRSARRDHGNPGWHAA